VHKSEKEAVVKELSDKFSRVKSAVVAEFRKLDVATVTNLRKKFRDGGVEYRVIKNTLARLAAKGTSLEALSDDFTGPVALALSYADVVAPAKILTDFAKDLETIRIRGGVVGGKKIDVNGVKALAKLPGLQELRATLLGLLSLPAASLVRAIGAPSFQLVRVIQARKDALGTSAQ
jgi:large subunit ribosomal protein L10